MEFHIEEDTPEDYHLYQIKSMYDKTIVNTRQKTSSLRSLPFSPISLKLGIKKLSKLIDSSTTLIETYTNTARDNLDQVNKLNKLQEATRKKDKELQELKENELNKQIEELKKQVENNTAKQ